jgi:hypothetical protein
MVQEDKMSKAAEGMLKDATGLIIRLDTYMSTAQNASRFDKQIIFNESALSVLEGLGSKIIRESIPEKVESLVSSLHKHTTASAQLVTSDKEKDKLLLNAAKAEAALKGFVLPLSHGGPADELNGLPGDTTRRDIAFAVTKQALKEFGNKQIPSSEFSEKLVARTQELLKEQGISGKELEEYKDFIQQGVKTQKPSKLPPAEQALIKEAALKSVDEFVHRFNDNSTLIPKIAPIENTLVNTFKELEKKGVKLEEAERKKIADKLFPALAKLDTEYLQNNQSTLAEGLAENINKNKSLKIDGVAGTMKSASEGRYSIPGPELNKIVGTLEEIANAQSGQQKPPASRAKQGIYDVVKQALTGKQSTKSHVPIPSDVTEALSHSHARLPKKGEEQAIVSTHKNNSKDISH